METYRKCEAVGGVHTGRPPCGPAFARFPDVISKDCRGAAPPLRVARAQRIHASPAASGTGALPASDVPGRHGAAAKGLRFVPQCQNRSPGSR